MRKGVVTCRRATEQLALLAVAAREGASLMLATTVVVAKLDRSVPEMDC